MISEAVQIPPREPVNPLAILPVSALSSAELTTAFSTNPQITEPGTQTENRPFDFLADVAPVQLVPLIQGEHPQAIALTLSHMPPEQAAQVLTSLSSEAQADVAMRIAQLEATGANSQVIRQASDLLRKKVESTQGKYTSVGGVKQLVEILKAEDPVSREDALEFLDESSPELADEIRKNMFTFDDLANLDPTTVARVFQGVNDVETIALALRGASQKTREKIIKTLGNRSGAVIDAFAKMGPQRLSRIEDAQQEMVARARRLNQAGEIYLRQATEEEQPEVTAEDIERLRAATRPEARPQPTSPPHPTPSQGRSWWTLGRRQNIPQDAAREQEGRNDLRQRVNDLRMLGDGEATARTKVAAERISELMSKPENPITNLEDAKTIVAAEMERGDF